MNNLFLKSFDILKNGADISSKKIKTPLTAWPCNDKITQFDGSQQNFWHFAIHTI
jgi:hypothetical protein